MDLREAVQRADSDLQIALDQSPLDQRKANEAIEHLATARGELTRTISQMTLRLRTILTNEQWQELQRRQAQRRAAPFRGARKRGALLPRLRAALDAAALRPRRASYLLRSPGLEPAQTIHGFPGGAIFAADPAFIADIVEDLEQIRVVDFAGIGFVTFGDAGDLDVLAESGVFLQLGGDVAFGDLHVIAVHLHFQVRSPTAAQNSAASAAC